MGIGDNIMSTAEARHYYSLYGARIVFGRNGEKPHYDPEIFLNNHKIAEKPDDHEKVVVVANYPGCRPYIKGAGNKRYLWNHDFNVNTLGPGELFLTEQEIEMGKPAKGKILIVPSVKDFPGSLNKAWPHWKAFVEMADYLPLIQFSQGERLVETIETTSFRRVLRYLSNVDLVITTDGALHHAAAAMNIPCITLWGGLISPDILGYDNQINIWHGAEPCGSWIACDHCKKAMDSISPEEVLHAVAVWSNTLDQTAQDASQVA